MNNNSNYNNNNNYISKFGFYCIPKENDIKSQLNLVLIEKLFKELNIMPTKRYNGSKSKYIQMLNQMKEEPICCLFETKTTWNIPRFYGIQQFGLPKENRIYPGLDLEQHIEFNGTLYDEQIIPVQFVLDQFNKNDFETGGLLSLPCGEGKTISAIYILSKIRKKTIIIVHKEFLMNQWKNEIQIFLPNAKIGIIQGDKCEIENNDIVIAMLQTLSKRDYHYDLIKEFGLAIYDECHHLGARMFSKVLQKLPCKYLLGLSAEPLRKDGMNLVFEYYLGNIIFKRERKNILKVFVYRFNCNSNSIYYQEHYDKKGEKQLYKMEENIVSFYQRNIFIIHTLINLFNHPQLINRQILILSARNEGHLPILYKLIEKYKIYNKSQNRICTLGYYVGRNGINKKKYNEILDESAKCDIILGTYDMAMEGLNIKTLNTILLASPLVGLQKQNVNGENKIFCNDIKQTIGRILRDKYSDQPRIVIDIVDNFSNYIEWARQRKVYYHKEKYIIHKQKIDLDDLNTYLNNNCIDYNWIFNNNIHSNSDKSINSLSESYNDSKSDSDSESESYSDNYDNTQSKNKTFMFNNL
jgi:superfamily II DNA or RNA helicase